MGIHIGAVTHHQDQFATTPNCPNLRNNKIKNNKVVKPKLEFFFIINLLYLNINISFVKTKFNW